MRVAVVGVGGTGSAACRYLAQAGHQVVGFEQFQLGPTNGSSHGESRIIRYTYPDLLYTQMMSDTYPLWAELEAQADENLFVRCGGLYIGHPDEPLVIKTEQSLVEAGLPYDRLGPDEVAERYPALRIHPDEIALFQKDSGFLRSTRCILANARLACQHGAEIREATPVADIRQQGDEVIVRTASGEEEVFDRVIVTAGAWMGKLFAGLQMPLKVTRQQVVYFAIREHSEVFEPSRMPIWIDKTNMYYGFPSDGVIAGAKLAAHDPFFAVDPDHVNRTVDTDYIERARQIAAQRLPFLSDEITYSVVCLYTNTPDEHFILDRVPDMSQVWLVSGCSGHGFKFTVLLGKLAADLATGGSYGRDLSRFALGRF